MFLIVAIVLLIIWLCAFVLLHVTSFFIHVLIILAVIAFIVHFARGSRT